jgi:hypothetical protein
VVAVRVSITQQHQPEVRFVRQVNDSPLVFFMCARGGVGSAVVTTSADWGRAQHDLRHYLENNESVCLHATSCRPLAPLHHVRPGRSERRADRQHELVGPGHDTSKRGFR